MAAEPISAFVLATRNPHKLAEVSRLLAPAGIAVDPLPDDVTLPPEDGATFSASLAGRRTETSPLRAAPAAVRASALIRVHGIALWARGLRVQPRPAGHDGRTTR